MGHELHDKDYPSVSTTGNGAWTPAGIPQSSAQLQRPPHRFPAETKCRSL
ncbi:hypothetical protein MGG_17910 [Pyricularia oryzae 70-15]|uniref:Uncharacterized protein n=3 Tax=Pyricularia oryzae TaxID=318829 RepID=G5EHI4_PYRO7|nr:uncharacterized protein MGG_17910 [Pyricularia oryzae 70-15]EAQ71322.1 hypothetical protein MGCH7_ch7g729 [Pyricularia oryzae 70-15]EHA46008.1 hypothetical protein MGG_17910 [Pyricularia oryzae 70-15]ELQ42657.1 hypothetical protein OOU_Y34scaffold00199g15 [Pyricularia oryzae Y34]